MKMLTRRGVLVEDMGQIYLAKPDADGEEARTLQPLQAAAVTYRIAFGARAGQKVLTLRSVMPPREVTARKPLCADIDGFSLHAAVRIEAHERKRLERLCRYITRPALSDERIQVNASGQVQPSPPYIRRVIYATKAIESLNIQLRNRHDPRPLPNDEAATMLPRLANRNLLAKTDRLTCDRTAATNQFAIKYDERFALARA